MAAVVLVLAATTLPTLYSGRAAGESLGDLKDRIEEIKAEIDALTVEVETLRTRESQLTQDIQQASAEIEQLKRRNGRLQERVIERAEELYKSGGIEVFEALLGADSFTDLSNRAEMLSQLSLDDNGVFVELHRSQAEQERLLSQLSTDREELGDVIETRLAASDELQGRLDSASADYRRYLARLQAVQPNVTVLPSTMSVKPTGDMTCPVAGPTSFTDTWGAPRAGHTHQGVDMMAAYGTPIVAIVSGTITYSGYHGSAGNWLILSGNNGHAYYYMHNQQNIVTGGHVSVGQQIGTVGDTGNAAGTPHLHFEYHPGGGAAVNPTPLVAAIC
jgi:murein DD-endopeptidase MepM/ murein hydrolase activator NlpD